MTVSLKYGGGIPGAVRRSEVEDIARDCRRWPDKAWSAETVEQLAEMVLMFMDRLDEPFVPGMGIGVFDEHGMSDY